MACSWKWRSAESWRNGCLLKILCLKLCPCSIPMECSSATIEPASLAMILTVDFTQVDDSFTLKYSVLKNWLPSARRKGQFSCSSTCMVTPSSRTALSTDLLKTILQNLDVNRRLCSWIFTLPSPSQLQVLSPCLMQVQNRKRERLNCTCIFPAQGRHSFIYLRKLTWTLLQPVPKFSDVAIRLASIRSNFTSLYD